MVAPKNTMRPQLSRVRGLGSAKEGLHHWWIQRVTAVALVPLLIWFVIGVVSHIGTGHAATVAWLKHPVTATLTILLLVAGLHHAQLGLQVVIEDYVHHKGTRLVSLLLIKGAALVLGVASVLSVLKLAFAG